MIAPVNRADVPSNTKIWFFDAGDLSCPDPMLMDQDDNVVPAYASRFDPNVVVLTPAEPLTVGQRYTPRCSQTGSFVEDLDFEVGAGPDEEAPPVPSVALGEHRSESTNCGDMEVQGLELTNPGPILVMDVGGNATLDPTTLTGAVHDAMPAYSHPYENKWALGSAGMCGGNWNFDAKGDPGNVRVATFDLAGNFSGWSEPTLVEAAACSVHRVGGRGASSFALVLAALGAFVGLRRRERK